MKKFLLCVFLLTTSCLQTAEDEDKNSSNVADVSLKGISTIDMPWNSEWASKSASDKEKLLKETQKAVWKLILKSNDAKCTNSSNTTTLPYGTNGNVFSKLKVSRGCTYDIGLSLIDASNKEMFYTEKDVVSYTIPAAPTKPSVDLKVCPGKAFSTYFDVEVCSNIPLSGDDVDLELSVTVVGADGSTCSI